MSYLIKTAKTIEEAIEAGLREINKTREEVEREVIEEPKSGFFGLGSKEAVVKLRYDDEEDISNFVKDILYDEKPEPKTYEEPKEIIIETSNKKESEKPKSIKDFDDGESDEIPYEHLDPRDEEKYKSIVTTKEVEAEEIYKTESQPVEVKEEFDGGDEKQFEEAFDIKPNEEPKNIEEQRNSNKTQKPERASRRHEVLEPWSDAQIVKFSEKYIIEIADEMGLKVDVHPRFDDEVLSIEITSDNTDELGIIIGKRGATLNSIQYILSQIINKHREEFLTLDLDANGYKEKRNELLKRMGRIGAQKALKSGRPWKLEPMNAADRRIIHLYLEDNDEIETYSEGKEPYRRIVIKKIDK